MSPAPKIETADGAYSFKVGGFAQVDAGSFNDDRKDHPDGTNVRRARLSVSGTITHDFNYKIENDFAGNASALTDVYLEYTGLKPVSFTIGQFKEPFGLETLTSDLFTDFVERASTNLFSPDRRIGAMVSANGELVPIGFWTASLGAFGSGTSSTASTDDEARDITGRLTWAPVAGKTEALHFGIAGSHRIPDSATDSFSFASRAENQFSSASSDLSVNTGTITSVDSVNLLGLEAAAVYGPASVQGEFVRAAVNRNTGLEPTFGGYYVEASYFLTGESRNYNAKTARFDRVKPKWPVDFKNGNYGAWQVMARYSDLDLTDKTFRGGELRDTTFGIKWLPNSNVMITANYIISNSDNFAVTPNDDPRIWVLRTQFDF
jgi:phosphate-selective porin OprO/OprP